MLFAHAPKLVLTGSVPALRAVADRAAALDADVVLTFNGGVVPFDDVVGFDWAIVAVDDTKPVGPQLDDAVEALAGGLRRGALVVVASDRPIEQDARRFTDDLARTSGLRAGESFAVVACEAGVVSWGVDTQAVDEARHLVSRIGSPSGSSAPEA